METKPPYILKQMLSYCNNKQLYIALLSFSSYISHSPPLSLCADVLVSKLPELVLISPGEVESPLRISLSLNSAPLRAV